MGIIKMNAEMTNCDLDSDINTLPGWESDVGTPEDNLRLAQLRLGRIRHQEKQVSERLRRPSKGEA
jgi:hypothetical protein